MKIPSFPKGVDLADKIADVVFFLLATPLVVGVFGVWIMAMKLAFKFSWAVIRGVTP